MPTSAHSVLRVPTLLTGEPRKRGHAQTTATKSLGPAVVQRAHGRTTISKGLGLKFGHFTLYFTWCSVAKTAKQGRSWLTGS